MPVVVVVPVVDDDDVPVVDDEDMPVVVFVVLSVVLLVSVVLVILVGVGASRRGSVTCYPVKIKTTAYLIMMHAL